MDLRKLKTLIDLVSESGVAELEITEGEDRVRIVNRNGAAPVQVHQPVTVAQPMPVLTTPSPCKGKSFKILSDNKAFALTGRLADCYYTQGAALG